MERLFEEAAALPAGERDAWLEAACADDAETLSEVREMLAVDGETGSLQEQVRAAAAEFAQAATVEIPKPRRAGPYRLTRELGRGGMGSVFLGERDDGEYEAQVAVKLIRAGLDTQFFLARFKRERQALARLEHPNIARIFDSGTTEDGLPYIVMELVRGGEPITAYARRKQLSMEQILSLYVEVCRAVSHAHQKFIVHRDLKPGNILVQEDGTPKLLDFGICKLIEDSPAGGDTLTGGLHLMTPEYASPEQIRDRPITTASDVYSLAAVLYELLTGRPPHLIPRPDPTALVALCEVPVTPPSKAAADPARAAELAGLLDKTLVKALQKDPERRYQNVDEFARDLRRVIHREQGLEGQAHSSGGGALGLSRRRRLAGGGALAAAALAMAVVWGVRPGGWLRPGDQPRRVDTAAMPLLVEAHRVMKVHPPGETAEGAAARARRAVQLFEDAARQFPASAQVQSGLAEAYLGAADHDLSKFYEYMERARDAAERGLTLDNRLEELHQSLGEARLFGFWEPAKALESFDRAVRLNPKLGHAQRLRADILCMFGRFDEAVAALNAVQAISPLDTEVGAEKASLYIRWRRYPEAEQAARQTLTIEPGNQMATWVLALALQQQGRAAEAEPLLRSLPPRPVRYPLSLAHLLLATGRASEAAPLIARLNQQMLSASAMALVPAMQGDVEGALKLLERALEARDINLLYVPMDPRYDRLRSEPRFVRLFERIGLPAAPHEAGRGR